MIEANEVKKPATRPESIERTRTMAGVMTARITEYSANVCPSSRRHSRKVFTVKSSCRRVVSAIPLWGDGALTVFRRADVAQLVEHHLGKLRVAGSNPVVRFKKAPLMRVFVLGG